MISAVDGGRLVGYARVSTGQHDLNRQLDALQNHGVPEELTFADREQVAKRSGLGWMIGIGLFKPLYERIYLVPFLLAGERIKYVRIIHVSVTDGNSVPQCALGLFILAHQIVLNGNVVERSRIIRIFFEEIFIRGHHFPPIAINLCVIIGFSKPPLPFRKSVPEIIGACGSAVP